MLFYRKAIANECLSSTLIPQTKNGCLIDCELYYKNNPDARPKNTNKPYLTAIDNIAKYLNPVFSYEQGLECLKSHLSAISDIPDQYVAYRNLVYRFADDYSQSRDSLESYLNECDKSKPCKRKIARYIYKYHFKNKEGVF
jgi:hypothetical protein